LAESSVDVIDACARTFPDFIFYLLLIIATHYNASNYIRVIDKIADYDYRFNTTDADTGYSSGLMIKFYILNLIHVIAFGTVGVIIGHESCDWDFIGMVKHVTKYCEVSWAINAVYTTIVDMVYCSSYLLFMFFTLAFKIRLNNISNLIRSSKYNDINEIVYLLGQLSDIQKQIFGTHSPQLFLRFGSCFISTLTLIFRAFIWSRKCHYDITFFMVLYALIDMVTIFVLCNHCELIERSVDDLIDYLNYQNEQTGQIRLLKVHLKCIKAGFNVSGFFAPSKTTFMMVGYMYIFSPYFIQIINL
jgi:hypothetical protein